jgi:hypothetical protein
MASSAMRSCIISLSRRKIKYDALRCQRAKKEPSCNRCQTSKTASKIICQHNNTNIRKSKYNFQQHVSKTRQKTMNAQNIRNYNMYNSKTKAKKQ